MDERKDFMFSRKDLQRLIIPLIVEQFLSITIGMADTVMVSVCGEAAVSGVSSVLCSLTSSPPWPPAAQSSPPSISDGKI